MKKAFSICFALFVLTGPAQAMPVSEVMDLRDRAQTGNFEARAAWSALVFYLQGVTEGIVASHKDAKTEGRATGFCPPANHSSDLGQIFTALELANSPTTSVAEAILANFQEQFPCY